MSLLLALSLLFTASATLMPSPLSVSYYEDGVSLSTRIERGSRLYHLNVKVVTPMGGGGRLEVSVSKLRDPAGPTALRQKQTWEYDLAGEFDDSGNGYRIDAGSETGPYRVNVTVKPMKERCGPHQRMFVTGHGEEPFRIETGNEKFGTITELPACAKRWSYANGTGQPTQPECPAPGPALRSSPSIRLPDLSVRESRDREKARINIYHSRSRTVAGHQSWWRVNVRGALPAKRFWLDRELRGALWAGGAPWLSGRARVEPQGPLRRWDWYECQGEREARRVQRRGAITGDLTFAVIGYENERIKAAHVRAVRSWVRPRS